MTNAKNELSITEKLIAGTAADKLKKITPKIIKGTAKPQNIKDLINILTEAHNRLPADVYEEIIKDYKDITGDIDCHDNIP